MKKAENKKDVSNKQEDISKFTIMQHIDKILALTKESKLEPDVIEQLQPYTSVMAEQLSLTEMQSVLLSLFVDNCNDTNIRYSDFAEYLQCSKVKLMCYDADFDALVQRQYIKKYIGKGTSFKIEPEVVRSLIDNKPFVPKPTQNIDIFALFECFDSCFDERENDMISTEELFNTISSLMDDNTELPFVKATKKCVVFDRYDNYYTALLFVYMCHLLVNNDDDNVGFHDFENIIDSKRNFSRIKQAMKSQTHELLTSGLIEEKKGDGLYNRDSYCLTKRVKADILKEFEIEMSNNTVDKNILKHDTIALKSLFYNDSEEAQIKQLSSLLEDENFKSVQNRLSESGMRKGFAVLFYGSPGTGKTESVYQLARATGRDIVEVNVSQIKSMWVGESEKNIKATFDNYRKLSDRNERVPILLFNEADAVLGVRQSGAERAVDKMENSIQNIILQEMESLDGIMIATTNLTENLDKAFERRFLYKIEFHKPSLTAKRSIWQSMMPTLTEEDAEQLAAKFDFSGGQIENIVRKQTVELIIGGATPSLETIKTYCHEENIDKTPPRRRIGF